MGSGHICSLLKYYLVDRRTLFLHEDSVGRREPKDLVDQLFYLSERRLARALLILAQPHQYFQTELFGSVSIQPKVQHGCVAWRRRPIVA